MCTGGFILKVSILEVSVWLSGLIGCKNPDSATEDQFILIKREKTSD